MPTLALDPVPILETTDSGLLLFRDNVQLNYDKLNAIVNALDSSNIKDGGITAADLTASLPQGRLGSDSVSTDLIVTTGITAYDQTISVTVSAGRRLKISAKSQLQSSTASNWLVDVLEDGINIGRIFVGDFPNVSSRIMLSGFVTRLPAAGTRAYTLNVVRFAGAGTLNVEGSSGGRTILVEDIGI